MYEKNDEPLTKVRMNKKTRRAFLKNIGLASVGAAAILTNGDKILARMAGMVTTGHVDEFLALAASNEMSGESLAVLSECVSNLKELCATDPTVRNSFESIKDHLMYENGIDVPHGQPVTVLGLPLVKSDTAVAAILWSMNDAGGTIITKREMAAELADPRNVLGLIEPDFIKTVAEKLGRDWRSDPELNAKLDDATARLGVFMTKVRDEGIDDGGGGPCDTTATLPCLVAWITVIAAIIKSIKRCRNRRQ